MRTLSNFIYLTAKDLSSLFNSPYRNMTYIDKLSLVSKKNEKTSIKHVFLSYVNSDLPLRDDSNYRRGDYSKNPQFSILFPQISQYLQLTLFIRSSSLTLLLFFWFCCCFKSCCFSTSASYGQRTTNISVTFTSHM